MSDENAAVLVSKIREEVEREMFGMRDVIELCLVAFFTRGHVLLEGNPGLGKTALVKTMARAMGIDSGRIQFTPDLMPADITGTRLPTEKGGRQVLEFEAGPIFTNLLLADEINRAAPKTQSALLEAMAESQVTVLGERYPLMPKQEFARWRTERLEPACPDPFMVLATQNPIEQEGTYPLPEAQADRFRFKILMPAPETQTLNGILKKNTGVLAPESGTGVSTTAAPNLRTIPIIGKNDATVGEACQRILMDIKNVIPITEMHQHILNLVLCTNGQWAQLIVTDKKKEPRMPSDRRNRAEQLVKRLAYGLGPRAAEALMISAKASALLFSSDKGAIMGQSWALAQVLLACLQHRLRFKDPYWYEEYAREFGAAQKYLGPLWSRFEPYTKNLDQDSTVAKNELAAAFIVELACLTAPDTNEYGSFFRQSMTSRLP